MLRSHGDQLTADFCSITSIQARPTVPCIRLVIFSLCHYAYHSCFPPVPSGLKIESLGASWILLSWNLNDDVESYIVVVSDGDKKVNYTVDSTHNSLNITGLKGNTEYNLSVIAVTNNGQTSSPSAILTAITAVPGRCIICHYVSMDIELSHTFE